ESAENAEGFLGSTTESAENAEGFLGSTTESAENAEGFHDSTTGSAVNAEGFQLRLNMTPSETAGYSEPPLKKASVHFNAGAYRKLSGDLLIWVLSKDR